MLTRIEEGPKTLANPMDYSSRANVMWSATLALNGLIGAGVPQDWATHWIGHELTGLYGPDHAHTLGVVLPSLLRTRRSAKREKLLQYGERVFGIATGSEEERMEEAIEQTVAFFEAMGVPTKLGAVGLRADEVAPTVVFHMTRRGRFAFGEHVDIGPNEVEEILRQAQ